MNSCTYIDVNISTCYEEGGLQRNRGPSDSTADTLVGPSVPGLDLGDEERAVGEQEHAVETCIRQVTLSSALRFSHLFKQSKDFFCPLISLKSHIFSLHAVVLYIHSDAKSLQNVDII